MKNKLQAKFMAYEAMTQQIYASLRLNEYDLTNNFTLDCAMGRSVRRLRAAIERLEKMNIALTHVPTSAELCEAIRLTKEGLLRAT